MNRLVKLIAINLLLLFILLGSIEGIVRLSLPQIRPIGVDRNFLIQDATQSRLGLQKGYSGTVYGYHFQTNNLGFWKYSNTKDKKKLHILLLGDSVSMGIGVAQDQSFGALLHSDSLHVDHLSFVGYNLRDYLVSLKRIENLTDYDHILLAWCLNDVYGFEEGDRNTLRSNQLAQKALYFVHNHVYTYQVLKKLFFDRPKSYYLHDLAYYNNAKSYRNALNYVNQIRAFLAENAPSTPLHFILLPYEYQLRIKDERPLIQLELDLSRKGSSVLNLFPFFAAEDRPPNSFYLFGDGIHFSENGHRLAAEHIADFLKHTPTY